MILEKRLFITLRTLTERSLFAGVLHNTDCFKAALQR